MMTDVATTGAITEEQVPIVPANEACGDPAAAATQRAGAYVEDEPAGWVAVEPWTAYPKLRLPGPVARSGAGQRTTTVRRPDARGGLPDDHPAWQGDHLGRSTRGRPPGQVLEEAGFEEASRPTVRRVVMRIDFGHGDDGR